MKKQRFEAEETLQALETRAHGREDEVPELNDTVLDDGLVAEAEPKKKRNPKVFLAVGGLAFAALVGVIGMQVMKGMGPPPPTPEEIAMQSPPPPPPPPVQEVAPPVGLMPSAQSGSAPVGMMDPQASAAPAASAAALVPSIDAPPAPPVAAPVAPVAPVVAAIQPAAPASPESAQPTAAAGKGVSNAELRRIDRRIDDLSRSLEALKAERQSREARLAASPTGSAAVAAAPKPKKSTSGETKVARSGSTKPSKASKTETKQPEVVVETPPNMATLPGLSLRAVYPPAGNDMQAWVLEGESVRVVSRGSVVGGARVIEVKSGFVVTDRGVIR